MAKKRDTQNQNYSVKTIVVIVFISALMLGGLLLFSGTLTSATVANARLTQCTRITEDGTYILQSDVTSDETCFTIGAANVHLDCNGHTITYGIAGLGGNGIVNNGYDYVTIEGCTITEGATPTQPGHAISFLKGSDNGKIQRNSITTRGDLSAGISVIGSNNNIVETNLISASGSKADGIMVLSGSNGNRIQFNTIGTIPRASTNPRWGLYLHSHVRDNVVEENVFNTRSSNVQLGVDVANTIFLNNQLVSIHDTQTDMNLNYLVYNNSFGEVKWTDLQFLQNLTFTVSSPLELRKTVILRNNVAAVDLLGLGASMIQINSKVLVTLKNLPFSTVTEVKKLNSFNSDSAAIINGGTDCHGSSCRVFCYRKGTLTFTTDSFSSFAAGEVANQPSAVLNGDTNLDGQIDSEDILPVVNHIINTVPLEGDSVNIADASCDGVLDVSDILAIIEGIVS